MYSNPPPAPRPIVNRKPGLGREKTNSIMQGPTNRAPYPSRPEKTAQMPRTTTSPCENEDGVERWGQEGHRLVTLSHPPSYKKLDICRMSLGG